MHHAFVIEAEAEIGVLLAQQWAEENLGIKASANPDFVVLQYGLLSVEDARKVSDVAAGAAFRGDTKVVVIAASRAYHEAQNALLKIFEEPPPGTYLFLILPSLGGLLPTLRSRVEIRPKNDLTGPSEAAEQFITATKEKRSAIIKKLTSGKDEEDKREKREEAIAILNGIEAAAYGQKKRDGAAVALLSDIAELRAHLYDRSAPVKMILEHLSLVTPKNLVQ